MTEDQMVGWHHRFDGHEFEQAPGVGDGQGSLACCSPWGHWVRHDWATELNLLMLNPCGTYNRWHFPPLTSRCMCAYLLSCVWLLRHHGLLPASFLCPWNFSGKNTRAGCHFLLQRTFLSQGLNLCLLCLLNCRHIFKKSIYFNWRIITLEYCGVTHWVIWPLYLSLKCSCNLVRPIQVIFLL